MYDIGTRVVVVNKTSGYHGVVGTVEDRFMRTGLDGKRRAGYLVEYGEHPVRDLVLGSKDLRPAEVQCDGCGGWRTRNQMWTEVTHTGPAYDDVESISLCFLCRRTDIQWPIFDRVAA